MALPSRSVSASACEPAGLIDQITDRFDVQNESVEICGQIFPMISVRDTNALLDAIDPAEFARDERLPYWAELWPSSIALARWCLSEPSLSGKRILELGCGLGLAGIAATHAGADVIMTDYDADALLFSTRNAVVNLDPEVRQHRLHVRHLDWRFPGESGVFDVVIGSDIVYERGNVDPILTLLESVLAPDGRAVFTDPGRQTGELFHSKALMRGFSVGVSDERVAWRGRMHTITTYSVRRAGEPR